MVHFDLRFLSFQHSEKADTSRYRFSSRWDLNTEEEELLSLIVGIRETFAALNSSFEHLNLSPALSTFA